MSDAHAWERQHLGGATFPTKEQKAVMLKEMGKDIVPVRLPSGGKAWLTLPRPLTVADATHLAAWIVQYVEGPQAEEARALVTPSE